jgi:hypothetical protein
MTNEGDFDCSYMLRGYRHCGVTALFIGYGTQSGKKSSLTMRAFGQRSFKDLCGYCGCTALTINKKTPILMSYNRTRASGASSSKASVKCRDCH